MDDGEHYVARKSRRRGRVDRRRSLGLAIMVASALATLMLIFWLVAAEVTNLPLN
jgi:fatty acid desaturase